MTAAQRTALWRANLRAQLGEQAYLQRQRDMKKLQRARIKAHKPHLYQLIYQMILMK